MDAARRAICMDDPFNPLVTTGMQVSSMLVISQIFHVIMKPLGQPGPIANILAGLVLGPSLLCRIKPLKEFFIQSSSANYYLVFSLVFRVFFMFLVGLDTDTSYMRRNFKMASTVAYGGIIVCNIFGVATTYFILHLLKSKVDRWIYYFVIPLIIANSASPVVIRLTGELKIDTSDIGRLGISSALINEMSCLLIYSTFLSFGSWKMFGKGVLCVFFMVVLIFFNRLLASWFNKRNTNEKYVRNREVLIIFSCLIALAFIIEAYGYQSTFASFLIGLMFPREGKTARTLFHKLQYSVHNFILPIYFGYIGFQFDVSFLFGFENLIIIGLMILLSFGGKIVGTLAASYYLKIPWIEGVVLAFMLNLKGHTELLILEVIPKFVVWWNERLHSLAIIVVVLDTIIAGSLVAFILRRQKEYFSHRKTSLELQDPDNELRVLTCVYGSRHVAATVGLIASLMGSRNGPTTPYMSHLVELPKKRRKTKLMYHQLKDGDQFSDEEEYGGNDVVEINYVVDNFTNDTKVVIRQRKVVSSYNTMHEDVCRGAEYLRVSIIFVHLHKHQRIDEKLETGKEGIRISNQKILRHAPCSVGILVDRCHSGFRRPVSESEQRVAILFFGGPDDREALACGRRMCMHPYVDLTVIRFLPGVAEGQPNEWRNERSSRHDDILLAISACESDTENQKDNAYLEAFCKRYVKSGRAKYKERRVRSGEQTAEALRELGNMYSLVIVGREGQPHPSMTTGLSEWEECTELGKVGDLLSSAEFHINASVLIIRQHRNSNHDVDE